MTLNNITFFKISAPGVASCPRTKNSNQYDNCIKQQLEAITPYLKEGIPSLKLPALDPLLLPSLTVDRNLDALKIKANMSKIYVYGATDFFVDEIHANPDALTVFIKVRMPFVHVEGDYNVQGRLLLLPLKGVGNFKGNFSKSISNIFINDIILVITLRIVFLKIFTYT